MKRRTYRSALVATLAATFPCVAWAQQPETPPAPAAPAPEAPAAEAPVAAETPAPAPTTDDQPAVAAPEPAAAPAAAAAATPEPPTATTTEATEPAQQTITKSGDTTMPTSALDSIDIEDSLGLSPGAPQVATLPGGMTPAFGSTPTKAGDWRFDFHGFLSVPLRMGFGKRENPGANQRVTTIHSPPRVPGEYETFEYTSVVPDPWVQLNFSYGNPNVVATVIVAARTVTNANGYFDPSKMLGINDAFLTFKGKAQDNVALNLNVGAFANRYGTMGEYDLGRYGTPLIGRIGGTGFTGTSVMDLGDVDLVTELGFQGQLNKAPVGVEPAGWNGFIDPNVGSSFAAHGHISAAYKRTVHLGAHYIHAFAQDDRATPQNQPDGNINVVGTDLRLTMGRFGHFYTGYAYTDANTARSVSGILRVLNAPGGPGLMREYLGPNSGGTGSLHTVGGQYDLSLGNLLRHPSRFEGNAPDLVFSLFSILTAVDSPEDDDYDGISKLKYGGELGYAPIQWLSLATRYDRVIPDIDHDENTHAIATAYVIFHSDWASQDQVTLQYSRYFNGSGATVIDGYPPERNPSIVPDEHLVGLTASMWW
jgi:hypothetical protein